MSKSFSNDQTPSISHFGKLNLEGYYLQTTRRGGVGIEPVLVVTFILAGMAAGFLEEIGADIWHAIKQAVDNRITKAEKRTRVRIELLVPLQPSNMTVKLETEISHNQKVELVLENIQDTYKELADKQPEALTDLASGQISLTVLTGHEDIDYVRARYEKLDSV